MPGRPCSGLRYGAVLRSPISTLAWAGLSTGPRGSFCGLDKSADGGVLIWQGVLEGLKHADGVPEEDVPPGSLRVTLHPYQRRALGWAPPVPAGGGG